MTTPPENAVKVRVTINVGEHGCMSSSARVYYPGDTFTTTPEHADQLITSGWCERVERTDSEASGTAA